MLASDARCKREITLRQKWNIKEEEDSFHLWVEFKFKEKTGEM